MSPPGTRCSGLGVAAVSAGLLTAAITAPGGVCRSGVLSGHQRRHRYSSVRRRERQSSRAIAAAADGDTIEVLERTCAANVHRIRRTSRSSARASAPPSMATEQAGTRSRSGGPRRFDLVVRGGKTDAAGGGIRVAAASPPTLIGVEVTANSADRKLLRRRDPGRPGAHLLLVGSSVEGTPPAGSGGIDSDGAVVSLERLQGQRQPRNGGGHAVADCDGCGSDAADDLRLRRRIWNFLGTLTLVDLTVSHNTAGFRGGGLRTDAAVDSAGVLTGGATIRRDDDDRHQFGRRSGRRHLGPVFGSPACRSIRASRSWSATDRDLLHELLTGDPRSRPGRDR